MSIHRLLGEVPIFEDLTEADLEIIGQRVRRRRFKENERIFHRSDPGVALYVILRGKVKIHYDQPDGTDSIIAILDDGEFFGELALLDGEERSANATTLEPSELVMLTREDLHDILERYPRISLRLLSTLAGRLRRTTAAYLAYSTLDVNGRLAMQLLRLADQHAVVTPEGQRINLRLTQTDLGSLVGASRESINKVMGSLRRQNILSVDDRGQITILNRAALARLTESGG